MNSGYHNMSDNKDDIKKGSYIMHKEEYTPVEIEIIYFEFEDIIITSGDDPSKDTDGEDISL